MLKRVDLFGTPVKLNFNGTEKSRSWTGVVFSFLVFAFVIWSVYHVGMDIILRKSPKTIMSQAFAENPEQMIISPDTFNFAFGLQDPINFFHYIDEQIYTVNVILNQLQRIPNENGEVDMVWSSVPLEIETCRTDHFGKLGDKFADIELDSLFCLKKEQSALENITIQGVFESPTFQYIQASIKRCIPKPGKPCKDQTILDDYLKGGFFAVYFNNMAIDPKNYTTPSFEYRDSFFSSTGYPYSKELAMWLNHVEMKSDLGWLTEAFETTNYIHFDKTVENLHFKDDSELILSFVTRVSKVITQYERSYTKMQDIFAEANGLAAAALIATAFFLRPYSNIKFFEGLINELFDVKDLKEGSDARSPKSRKRNPNKKQSLKQVERPNVYGGSPGSPGSPKNENGVAFVKIDINEDNPVGSRPMSPDRLLSLNSAIQSLDRNRKNPEEIPTEKRPPVKKRTEVELSQKKTKLNNDKKKAAQSNNSQIRKDLKDPENEAGDSAFKMRDHTFSEIEKMGADQTKYNEYSSGNLPMRMSTYKSQLLPSRPNNVMPQRILENYEGKSLSEIDVALESLIFEKEEKMEAKERISEKSIDEESFEQNGEFEKRLAEIDNEDPEEKNLELTRKASILPDKLKTQSDKIDITFWDYVKSYIPCCRSKRVKEKYALLNEGIRRIEERLDIFNVLKKFREIDKLKLLLLESEQLVLFDTLPKPELATEDMETEADLEASSKAKLRESKFITDKRRHDLIAKSYELLKKKQRKTMIDEKLLEIYDDLVDES